MSQPSDASPPQPPSAGRRRGRKLIWIALAAYFALCIAIGWFSYGSRDGVAIIGTWPRIMGAIDARRLAHEVENVPARDLPAAFEKSHTELGQLLNGVLNTAESTGKQFQATFAGLTLVDPDLAHVLEPSSLGDRTSHNAALFSIEEKLKIFPSMPAKIDSGYADTVTGVSALAEDFDRNHSEAHVGSSVIAGMNKTLPQGREEAKATVAGLGIVYTDVADLIRRPTVALTVNPHVAKTVLA
jgi:hypothetical protein